MGLIPRLPRVVFACFKSVERAADRLTGAVGPVFVALAWILISVGIVYFFDVVAPNLSWPLLQLPLCILCATNMLGHYYLACNVPPGTPDDMKGTGEETGWMWARRRRHAPDLGVAWNDSRSRVGDWGTTMERGKIGRCKRCFKQKPERAHHCKVCKTCILKFDHHCPVGLRNERHFVLFMAWFVISCSCFVLLGYEYLWPAIAYQSDNWHSRLPPTGYVLIYVLALALGFAVSVMLFWHLYLVSSAESTVENYDFARYREVAKSRGTEFVNSYDLGRMKNLMLFFNLGPSGYPLYTLLLPLRCAPPSDGVSWTRRPGYPKHYGIGEGDEMTDVEEDDEAGDGPSLALLQNVIGRHAVSPIDILPDPFSMSMSRETAPESDNDSLFGEGEGTASERPPGILTPARRRIPPNVQVEGLYFDPDVCLPESVALDLLENIKEKDYFRGGTVNQLMLFERSYDIANSDGVEASPVELAQTSLRGESGAVASSGETASSSTTLPPFLIDLLSVLSDILRPHIAESTYDLLFPNTVGQSGRRKPARQAILNLYRPGEGITPHVDLLKRFGDGIIIVSLGSGTVMQLAPAAAPSSSLSPSQEKESVDVWLEPRSILVLEKDARYKWTHGIPARKGDWVENDMILSEDDDKAIWVERDVRVSITLRWLLPGAEIVGGVNEDSEMS